MLGIDFDNTIVSYDKIFYELAVKWGAIPTDCEKRKTAVRDSMRKEGKEDLWTEMQAHVYGKYMKEAEAFDGVKDFFRKAKEREFPICIVSHKTLHPYKGPRYNLHETAREWLFSQGFMDSIGSGSLFFEQSKELKMQRIAQQKCVYFIDDLIEFLEEENFPKGVNRYLFDPFLQVKGHSEIKIISKWKELEREIYGTASVR